ncbi:hypothetical protein FSP39_023410, partial [Pinctada imbricata]
SQIVEEAEMWSRFYQKKEREKNSNSSHPRYLDDRRVDMSMEYSSSRSRRAHMDEEPEKDTFWMRQLHKCEEIDPNR